MRKRLIALALALLAFGVARPAEAATPSKTTEDLTAVASVTSQTGMRTKALLWVNKEPTVFAKEQLQRMEDFRTKSERITDYFPEEIRQTIASRLPVGETVDDLKLSEFTSIGIGTYSKRYGDVYGTFRFPTVFEAKQPITVLVGYPGRRGIVLWQMLETAALEGKLWILFPEELMLKVGHDAVLTVLTQPVPVTGKPNAQRTRQPIGFGGFHE
jgi:hypothetical protein